MIVSIRAFLASVFIVVAFASQIVFAQIGNPRWQLVSEQGRFALEVYVEEDNIPLRKFQDWRLRIVDSKGDPVNNARIVVGGGMPAHGHGLPSQPRMTRQMGEGVYFISGLKFNMAGDWLLTFDVQSSVGADRANLEFNIAH